MCTLQTLRYAYRRLVEFKFDKNICFVRERTNNVHLPGNMGKLANSIINSKKKKSSTAGSSNFSSMQVKKKKKKKVEVSTPIRAVQEVEEPVPYDNDNDELDKAEDSEDERTEDTHDVANSKLNTTDKDSASGTTTQKRSSRKKKRPKLTGTRESAMSYMSMNTRLNKRLFKLWDHYAKTKNVRPGFQRKSVRLISKHAINVAASGAAANTLRTLQREVTSLGLQKEHERASAPWAPTVTRGAEVMLTAFLSQYLHEAMWYADVVRQGSGRFKKVHASHVKIGFERTIDKISPRAVPHILDKCLSDKPSRKAASKVSGSLLDNMGNDADD